MNRTHFMQAWAPLTCQRTCHKLKFKCAPPLPVHPQQATFCCIFAEPQTSSEGSVCTEVKLTRRHWLLCTQFRQPQPRTPLALQHLQQDMGGGSIQGSSTRNGRPMGHKDGLKGSPIANGRPMMKDRRDSSASQVHFMDPICIELRRFYASLPMHVRQPKKLVASA